VPSQQQRDEGDTGAARRGPTPLVCELFQGIETQTSRAGVPDQQMFWCDGFMPLAPRKLRTLYGVGPKTTFGAGIVCYFFYNLGATPYAVVFLADGSVVQFATQTGVKTQILPPLSISMPSIANVGVTQYASQYLVIVANQSNGYWVWDGTAVYTAGSLGPGVTLTNIGSGYTSPPVVTATGGHGVGATFVAGIANGSVTSVTMTNPGSGYQVGDVVTLTFTGGNQSGTGANLTAVLTFSGTGSGASATAKFFQQGSSGGNPVFHVSSVTINSGGAGYSNLVQATIAGGVANNNPAVLSVTLNSGVITAITVTSSGDYFSFNTNVHITDAGFYFVSSVNIVSGGSLYSNNPIISVTGGGNPQTQAVITPIVSGGVIVGTNITNPGVYGSNTPPSLAVTDTAVTAAGTVTLMPFGVQGTAVQTYAGHVWVANGNVIQFTAPGSVSDFATSDGGGTITSSDNFLRVKYVALIQSNGFLFLVGDSSMNYISGVQTNTPAMGNPTTTFTNNNSDPEIGTPYPATVTTFSSDIFLANPTGIFVSAGGTFEKKSDPLDGVYNSIPNFAGVQLSSAKATIFGQRVWMALVPIVDPVSGRSDAKLLMFNGKFWWTSLQDTQLSYIAGQEIASVFTAWGTDGTSMFQLFQQPAGFVKTMQTRLWDAPAGYDHTKSSVRLFALAQFFGNINFAYNVTIDNEGSPGSNAGPYIGVPTSLTWINAGGFTVNWFNASNAPVTWYCVGPNYFSVLPPTAIGQIGVLTGMTTTTQCDDMVLVSEMMQDEIVQYRG